MSPLARGPLLLSAGAAGLLAFAAKLYAGPGAHWPNAYAAGVFYELFWIFAALWVRPDLSPRRVAGAVFAITCALEVLQLWHPPFLTAIRSTFPGAALIGTTFSWWDFPHYAAGCALGILIARALAREPTTRTGRERGTP